MVELDTFWFLVRKFRGRCCYCYNCVPQGISVCSCGLSICAEHRDVHARKVECVVVFEIEKNPCTDSKMFCIKSAFLNAEEINELEMIIYAKIGNEDEDLDAGVEEEKENCSHMASIEEKSALDIGDICKIRCELCDVRRILWGCFSCGYIGCGRRQYGVEGNGHAKQHYEQTQHSVFFLIQSLYEYLGPRIFCYTCDSFVENPLAYRRIKSTGFTMNSNEWKQREDVFCNNAGEVSIESPYTGITNVGNTCYISCVLQMISCAVSRKEFDLEFHFHVCLEKNPLECLFCQLLRVLNGMKNMDAASSTRKIPISNFVKLVWKDMPLFSRGAQHDAHEFLIFLLDKIREGENMGIFPEISKLFYFEVGEKSTCNKCDSEPVTYETMCTLCADITDDIRKSVGLSLKDYEWCCDCGGRKKVIKFISKLPEYLIVHVGRYKHYNDEVKKVNDKIRVENLDLCEFVEILSPNSSLIMKSDVREHVLNDTASAQQSSIHDDGANCKIFEEKKRDLFKSAEYKIAGCIIHSGESTGVGHYTWWTYSEEGCYLIDDANIFGSDKRKSEDGCMFLFERLVM